MHGSTPESTRPVALVTGASAGLGVAFVRALARRGYDLILVRTASPSWRKLRPRRLRSARTAEVLPADLTHPDDLARVAQRLRTCERLALLVNNAGFGLESLYHRSALKARSRWPNCTFWHCAPDPCRLARHGCPRSRRVINVSSVAAYLRGAGSVMYCATKAFLNSFSLSLASELAGTGVSVQALCPGYTYTEFHDVMHMDRKIIPKFLWLQADYVVEQSLRNLERHRVISIPSVRYKLVVGMLRIMPQWLMNRVARRRYKRK